jgi:hypothetical protein
MVIWFGGSLLFGVYHLIFNAKDWLGMVKLVGFNAGRVVFALIISAFVPLHALSFRLMSFRLLLLVCVASFIFVFVERLFSIQSALAAGGPSASR